MMANLECMFRVFEALELNGIVDARMRGMLVEESFAGMKARRKLEENSLAVYISLSNITNSTIFQ
jgi:hypothetical protein